MKVRFDWISGLLVVVLLTTLFAFFTGIFPYPYGWIVISIMLLLRLTATQKRE